MLRKTLWLTMLLFGVALLLAACPAPAAAPAETGAEAAAPAEATVAPAEEAPAEEASAEPTAAPAEEAAATTGECAPAADGVYAGVDPSGQTVVWWHQHTGSREEGLLSLLEKFNAGNPCGITVEAQNQGTYDDIREKVNASIAAGELPAALIVGYQNDQEFYQVNDALVDLNPLVDDATWGLTADEKADFYAGFFDQSVHPLFDNQRLGFPPNRSMEVLYYNQTWLEELGFSGPPTTPDEFREMACAAAEANGDGTGGYILRDDASAVASWTYAYGGDVLTEDKSEYVYNSPATVDSLTFLKGLFDDGCAYFFTEGNHSTEFANRRGIFAQGSTSGLPFYAGDIETVAGEQGRDPDVWGVTAIPYTTDEPILNVYGGDVMIPVTTPEQELAAWIFVKWFTSPEIQAEWDMISGYFPTRASTTELLTDYVTENPQWGEALALLPNGYYEPQFISYAAVRDAATSAFNEIMQGADVKTTLDNLTTFANEQQAELMSELE